MVSWRMVHDMEELTGLGSFCAIKVHCAELVLLLVSVHQPASVGIISTVFWTARSFYIETHMMQHLIAQFKQCVLK